MHTNYREHIHELISFQKHLLFDEFHNLIVNRRLGRLCKSFHHLNHHRHGEFISHQLNDSLDHQLYKHL